MNLLDKIAGRKNFQPNFKNELNSSTIKDTNGLKRMLEKALAGKTGEKLDAYFFKLTLNRWKNKFTKFNQEEFDLHMRSRKKMFLSIIQEKIQTKVLDKHKESLSKFSLQLNALTTEAA